MSDSTDQVSISDWLQLDPRLLSGQQRLPVVQAPDPATAIAPINATTILAAPSVPDIATILPVSRAYASPEQDGMAAALAELRRFTLIGY
jgi:hypothetical protein